MNAVPITGCTRILNKPEDWDEDRDGHCGHLAVRDEQRNGMNYMVSAWQPSAADIAALQAGGVLLLYVVGNVHLPVAIITSGASESQVN